MSNTPQELLIPAEFVCPITDAVMEHPVMDREGNTYEKAAIETWLSKGNGTSPITRNPLTLQDLAPNRALKDSIEAFLAKHKGTDMSTAKRAPKGTVPLNPTPTPVGPTPATTPGSDFKLSFVHDDKGQCLLSLQPPPMPEKDRIPLDIVCVIDCSGSMSTLAEVQNEKGEAESHGLTLLDVVTHAAKTVAHVLGPNDRLSFVAFSNVATTPLPLTNMTAEGQKAAINALDVMSPGGRTNLWDGLQTAMDLLKVDAEQNPTTVRNRSVMLLTDGRPNCEPPRGYLPTLKNYMDKLGGTLPFTVNTFGFGYDLDSELLNDIAKEAGGMYVFIPDSGLVGTVFVNCVSNLLATIAPCVSISVQSDAPLRAPMLTNTAFGAHGTVGGLQYGQSRDFFFQVTDGADSKPHQQITPAPPDCSSLFAKAEFVFNGKQFSLTASVAKADFAQCGLITAHGARTDFCEAVTADHLAGGKRTGPSFAFEALGSTLTNLTSLHPLLNAVHEDLSGQVKIAFSKAEYFAKWGKHYLPSLVRANILQQCNNFKDKTVQQYGGAFFNALRDQGEATFLKLPPPTPKHKADPTGFLGGLSRGSVPPRAGREAERRSQPAYQPVQMSAYYNCGGGCVAPTSQVQLEDGSLKKAVDVVRGDRLSNGATVVAAVRIRTPDEGLEMVTLKGGLTISPYHPIRQPGGEWVFPTSAACKTGTTNYALPYIYNFVLDRHHVFTADGLEVVSLGHGLNDNDVVSHEYFGSDAVIQDLQRLDGFAEGAVTVQRFLRDATTHRVNGLL